MKALKEKRISLRSLWRRSLVILSLLALVFASCGSSDSGDNNDTNIPGNIVQPKDVKEFRMVRLPDPDEMLEGMPVDLSGMVGEIRYHDGTFETVTDYKKFQVIPRFYDYQVTEYQVIYTGSLNKAEARDRLYIPFQAIIPLESLHVTGRLAKEAYFIDEIIKFDGVELEGQYYNNLHRKIPMTSLYDYRYEAATVGNSEGGQAYSWFVTEGPGSPYLAIQLGSNPNGYVEIRLGDLYVVDTVTVETPPSGLTDIFYDEELLYAGDDLGAAANREMQADMDIVDRWARALGDAVLKVSYLSCRTGDRIAETRSFSLNQMTILGETWAYGMNPNIPGLRPYYSQADNSLQLIYPVAGAATDKTTNWWRTTSIKGSVDVTVVYRFRRCTIKYPIYSKYIGFEVTPNNEPWVQAIDNTDRLADSERTLKEQFTAAAIFQQGNDVNKTAKREVKYTNEDWYITTPKGATPLDRMLELTKAGNYDKKIKVVFSYDVYPYLGAKASSKRAAAQEVLVIKGAR
jgi:hypothetical protein